MMDMSKEYATALFMLASEENCRQEVLDSLAAAAEIAQEHDGYLDFLSSPAISIEERLAAIDAAFGTFHVYVVSFLKLLCERSYIRFLPDAARAYEQLFAAASKVLSAKVTSAVALTEEEQTALKQKLEEKCGHPVVIETMVDAAILGGMIIEIDGKIMDASLRRRLGDIKDVISR